MDKLIRNKYWWLIALLVLVGINWAASLLHWRLDLTQEKRYTLSPATIRLLDNLDDKVTITVFLEGDMPAGFRKLTNSTRELLQEFRESAVSHIQFNFVRPSAPTADSTGTLSMDSLMSLGLKPTNVRVRARIGEGEENRYLFPGALVTYKDRVEVVDLLQGQDMMGGLQSLNNAEALLEFKFAQAIQKLTIETPPVVGYLLGNGEPFSYNVYDLIQRTLKPGYGFGFVPIDSVPLIPMDFDVLLVVKPTSPFSDAQKLKLDQYVMQGGKIIWLIDKLYAEMDSLLRKQSDFVAFDRGLNLDDLLFRYGARINGDLLQDLECDQLPLAVGSFGDRPQLELLPWQYFPLLSGYSHHPISDNLDKVLSIFPNSLDTVKAPGIRKTVLLASSPNARLLTTPAIVSLNSVKTEDDLKTFNKPHIPVAVLLEGRFSSLYANRLSKGIMDTLAGLYGQPFRAAPVNENKMIVVADADIVSNVFTQKEGPLPMGYNQFTNYQYANREFFLNCVEYLVNPSGIMETRSKRFALRSLDPVRVEEDKTAWQLFSLAGPVALIALFGFGYQWLRKKKYQ
ncbi:MAG: gliding motility-associated ABC transporter substrate-binding protein GldG [Candidatus Pseudobacter hemicellulosilyticus]|uniref:Gliding motility-associated ABC transporter substrate-binding protein GldG n=1 Tax=Candidatus Pseudobacter hemicellulosilyticus TaxID=3121375 RepID=A0AAJ5WTI8_9BACT|nr:MAG: gliding motility-associated ABC transporter substrate-binding protein GldG [Pseudobacter sp.]